MKILVFSDSHRALGTMYDAIERLRPDAVLHLGDHLEDAASMESVFSGVDFYHVPGNCDFASREQDTLEFFAGPVKVFATHGHRYYVKSTMDSLLNAAHFSGAKLVLYGHTHIAHIDYPAGMTVVNPGSSGLGAEPSFAQIDISDGGGVAARILPMLPKDRYM